MGKAYDLERAFMEKVFSPNTMVDKRWQNLRLDEMYELGEKTAELLRRKKIILGADSRKTSREMVEAFKKGYEKKGGEVLDCGNHCTTPMIEYLGHVYGLTSVMITASHLDESWQGIKIRLGKSDRKKAFKDYIESFPKYDFKLSVTVDYFEGSVSRLFPVIAARNNIHIVKELNAKMSGDYKLFPSQSPDPTIPKNLDSIIKAMKGENNNSRLGVAFDGDGDRHVFVFRHKGEVRAIDPVLLIAISAMHYKCQEGYFVVDPFVVPAENAIESTHNKMVRAKRGRPNMIKKILELRKEGKKVLKGMEGSYHGYDSDGFDDGIRQTLEFCTYLEDIDIEEAQEKIGCNYTLEMRVKCENNNLLTRAFLELEKLGGNPDTFDGIWVKNSFIARKSSREDAVSFLFYGKDPKKEIGKDLEKEMKRVRDAISSIYPELAQNLEEEFKVMQKYKKKFYW